jgi:hypothetical protein
MLLLKSNLCATRRNLKFTALFVLEHCVQEQTIQKKALNKSNRIHRWSLVAIISGRIKEISRKSNSCSWPLTTQNYAERSV